MQKIIPYLWFEKVGQQAADFYTSVFPGSRLLGLNVLSDTPSGRVEMVDLEIYGYRLGIIAAGTEFRPNPSISFIISCGTKEEVDSLYNALAESGKPLMPLGEYPFSGRYGWIEDRYGVSWQIMLADVHPSRQKITPTLMFTGAICGRAEEAVSLYTRVFSDSSIDGLMRYDGKEGPDKAGTIQHGAFTLAGQAFAAMDSAYPHQFGFTEGVSFQVFCADQAELNHYWDSLTADPAAEQCGWLKDKFGLSWQIVPLEMERMQREGTPEQQARLTQAFLQMKKFDIAALRKAFEG